VTSERRNAVNTGIWLCPQCGDALQSYNLRYGVLVCEGCGCTVQMGEEEQVLHESHVPPIPDPESDDE
jgi:ssDNA-binding Zn-finger/Zn-ribbon topoisomerase 1